MKYKSDNTGLITQGRKLLKHLSASVTLNQNVASTRRASGTESRLEFRCNLQQLRLLTYPSRNESGCFATAPLALNVNIKAWLPLHGIFWLGVMHLRSFRQIGVGIAERLKLLSPVHIYQFMESTTKESSGKISFSPLQTESRGCDNARNSMAYGIWSDSRVEKKSAAESLSASYARR